MKLRIAVAVAGLLALGVVDAMAAMHALPPQLPAFPAGPGTVAMLAAFALAVFRLRR